MMERRTVRKWFWVWDFEREEQWLNLMAQEGWLLDDVGFAAYRFVHCEPGEYTVRLEMHSCDDDYVDFMRQTGAEYVGRVAQWMYFRKRIQDGPFDLFSDIESRISHLDRIGRMLAIIGGANLLIGTANSMGALSHLSWINLLCGTLLMYALGRIHGKRESLLKERLLRE